MLWKVYAPCRMCRANCEQTVQDQTHSCDALQVLLRWASDQMLRVRSYRRIANGDSVTLPAVERLPIAQSQSSKPRVPLVPLALLFLCGLVAARVFPESSLISGEAGLGPGIVLPQLQQPEVSLPGSIVSPNPANLTGVGLRCQTWCLTRDIYVTKTEVGHCQRQCTAHPEVMDWIPALKASAAAPAGINDRQLIFAAWYAEGEKGSEVGFTNIPAYCSLFETGIPMHCSSSMSKEMRLGLCLLCIPMPSKLTAFAMHEHPLSIASRHALLTGVASLFGGVECSLDAAERSSQLVVFSPFCTRHDTPCLHSACFACPSAWGLHT